MRILFQAAVAVSLLAASACEYEFQSIPDGDAEDLRVGEAQSARAREELAVLPPAGKPHMAGYTRDRFGDGWTDGELRDGCDTRNDILARDVSNVQRDGDCRVTAGVLHDPYTGRLIKFRRGVSSADVQIDHLFPLHRAWMYGAWKWPKRRRVKFANDRGNLRAVAGQANASKGDSGPAEWTPPNRAYRCAYATEYIDIARIYKLPVTRGDRAALARLLSTCPKDQKET